MKTTLNLCLALLSVICLSACSKSNNAPNNAGSNTGIGGSLARFAITNDHLYTVSDQSISIFNVSDANNPFAIGIKPLGFGVETIFPKGNALFIGTQNGMKIMDVSTPSTPVLLSDFGHIRSCDPVVANDNYAFVTLRTDNTCTRGTNELQIVDITDLTKPKLFKTYTMFKPYGLAIDGDQLFICDQGIKFYDAADPGQLILKKTFPVKAEDLIAHEGILMAIGSDGLNQYSYQTGDLVFLSRIPIL